MPDCLEELNRYKKLLIEYKKAVDASSILSKTNPKGIITYVNERFCELSGYSREELIGKPHNIVRHPNMPSEAFEDLWNHIKESKIWRGMVENLKKDGSSYFVDATIVPIVGKSGELVEIVGLRHDITDLIMKERELEELRMKQMKSNLNKALEINFEKMLSFIPTPALIIDLEFRVISHNSEFYNLFNAIEHKEILESLKNSKLDIKSICKSCSLDFDEIEFLNSMESFSGCVTLIDKHSFDVKLKSIDESKYLVIFIEKED